MSATSVYVVTWQGGVFLLGPGDGGSNARAMVHVTHGLALPDWATPDQVEHLVSVGLVVEAPMVSAAG